MRTAALMKDLRARLDARGLTSSRPSSSGATLAKPQLAGIARPKVEAGWPKLPEPPTPKDAALLEKLRKATVAKIGVGRAGTRLRTATLLEFLGGRAVAVEAVRSELPDGFDRDVGAKLSLQTLAKDLDDFLFHPERGRKLPDEALQRVLAHCRKGADVQPIIGDGLSAKAVAANAPAFIAALRTECQRLGLSVGDPIVVRHARVKLIDTIGAALGARTAVILVGERPALGTGDGMSAYLMIDPRAGAMDSDREVVSNINERSFKPALAAARVAEMLKEFLRVGVSGVKRLAGPNAKEPLAQGRCVATSDLAGTGQGSWSGVGASAAATTTTATTLCTSANCATVAR